MRRRLLPLALSLLLLIAQQLGTQHLLAHVLQLDGHGPAGLAPAPTGTGSTTGNPVATANFDTDTDSDTDAGDALCQVCLVLATLAAVAGPVAWALATRHVRGSRPQPPAPATPLPQAWAAHRARGPPGRPAAA